MNMPKRTSHFGDHSSLQLKTSLREKEIVNGASQQICLQSAYACHNCRQPLLSRDVMKCQFCGNYNCCNCVKQCRGCHLHFCHLCLDMNCDQSAEKVFCLTCQSRAHNQI